jgi:hypothetical protein
MKKIPTVEEFMTDEYQIKHYGTILLKPKQAAIEFAKLHVKAALEAAADNAEVDYWRGDCQCCQSNKIDKRTILNAYPETNIV